MNINLRSILRTGLLIAFLATLTVASTQLETETAGTCGGASVNLPFTDVAGGSTFFCSIAGAYFSGLTNGTTATTYSPGTNVTRDQMAAFVTRTLDQSLKRGSRRAALNQNWTTQTSSNLGLTTVGSNPLRVQTDGTDLWVINSNTVSRVRASDGRLLETWSGANGSSAVLCAMGKVFLSVRGNPGRLFQINPTQTASGVALSSALLGSDPIAIAFDGQNIWTANIGQGAITGSVSIITPDGGSATNISTGFSELTGIIYDGANIWVTDQGDSKLKKLDSNGNVLISIAVGADPSNPIFDGANIWVPNSTSNTVTVVRATGATSGTVLATLSGNGLSGPISTAFDGERILVVNGTTGTVSLWKASDLTPIDNVPMGALAGGACSDGLNFWITLFSAGKLARF